METNVLRITKIFFRLHFLSAVAEAEGIEPLVKSLNAERHGAVANAATVLTNMAMQEPLRLSIQSHGVMSVLTEPLRSSSSQVQSRAALTVAAFGCDANARSEVKVFSKIGIVCKNSES